MAEIFHELPIKVSPSLVYRMLTEAEYLSQWWLTGAKIEPQEGAIGRFPLSDGENYISIRVTQLIPNKKVVWQCLGHKFPEWTGTQISFEITADSLLFHHSGWKDNSGVFGRTSFFWALYLQNLRKIAESEFSKATK